MTFVLDASVALTWLLQDASKQDMAYASSVLKALRSSGRHASVSGIWGLEIANVIARGEAQGQLTEAQSGAFLEMLQAVSIAIDPGTAAQALADTLQLARRHSLSSYDASYLELALRLSLPMATLDAKLRRAAGKAGVRVYKPD